jgi:nicotinate-nucleotide adenylyltransferase
VLSVVAGLLFPNTASGLTSIMTNTAIGVFGGTFDPPHFGHLVIAEEARARLGLRSIIFLPAGQPPHKPERAVTPVAHRLAMVLLAIAGNPGFRLSRLDVDRPGPSYTAHLLEMLQAELGPDVDLCFIVGMDSLGDLLRWHEPARVLRIARLVAATRPGYTCDLSEVERAIPGASSRIILLEAPALEISSTELQTRVRAGLPIRYQAPDAVARYIRQHGLYAATGPAEPIGPGETIHP